MPPSSPRDWLGPDDEVWRHLTPGSRRALETAAALQGLLPQVRDADWSPVPLLFFKAFEMELLVLVLRPFRTFLKVELPDQPLTAALAGLKDEEWSRPLARFLRGGRPPALAETMATLASLQAVAADAPDVCALLKRWVRRRLPLAHHLWGPRRVAHKAYHAVTAFRNPYSHDSVAGPAEVRAAHEALWGRPPRAGLLVQAFRVLTRGLLPPEPTAEPCDGCGEPLWFYPLRDPDVFCPVCPTAIGRRTAPAVSPGE